MRIAAPFPLQTPAPVGARPGPVRPYAVTGARLQTADPQAVPDPRPVYDPRTQTAAYADGTPLTAMATSKKTNPDGDTKNPPQHDEGADPGVFE
ncbi:putative ATP-grasp-modified RiPP [Streptomyces sp. H10-C2]|uniref:putative ATP-grasp-modified RiPP n=1 Tax=Streptomyces TaxID=1883 RepID=UPI0018DF6C2E|nr:MULTISPECIES: putative ATP-grasp-modified RiPP [Streptomyces]MDJ0344217.1 putative ATP-grasp-modified RiPP [Streptomyces sp. PH10-H1]MDJ0373555.1 putative ATP-grasp-modified RiPP [Streptomyces sp. H10-C2]